MKKLILLFALIASGYAANAQEVMIVTAGNAESRANKLTETMAAVTGTTDEQTAHLNTINLERMAAMDKTRSAHASDEEAFAKAKNEILLKWRTDISKVLTREQMTKWREHTAAQAKNGVEAE